MFISITKMSYTYFSLFLFEVFDSSEESGYLVLTIVISGHFFISQGQTLLVGFMHMLICKYIYLCSLTLIFILLSFLSVTEIHQVLQTEHLSNVL